MAEGKRNEIVKRLDEEGNKRGLDSRLLEFYQKLLTIQTRSERLIGDINPGLDTDTVNERQAGGLPLINFDKLVLDWDLLNDIFSQVSGVFAEYSDLFGEMPSGLSQPESLSSLPKRAVKAWFKKSGEPSATDAGGDGGNEYLLLEAIIHATLKPFLVNHARALIGSVNQEHWRRDYCPVCGGKPDLAFLDSEKGARWLLCSRCDTEWLFQRLQCPYCGSQNQEDLYYFTDDTETYRLYVCDHCHRYIKAIDLRSAKPGITLSLERVLTLDMDEQAREKGYQPGLS